MNKLTTLITREPNTAVQNPWTSKPGMTPDTILSIRAFITKVKRPKVRIFMGSVKRITIGRKKALSTPNMAAAKKAEKKPLVRMPSRK
jgi:hypothetical protein